jgi:pimeloyl-ACP methyl ester carboxylesterase
VQLEDYAAALSGLRRQPDVDATRIVLLGGSEGTVLAPRLALREPAGIVGVVLSGYVEDNIRDVLVWQRTVGPWRNVARFLDADADDVITREEFRNGPGRFAEYVFGPDGFDKADRDGDGRLTPADLAAANRNGLNAVLEAVKKRDDDWLWHNLLNLSSAYLLEEWDRGPNHQTLLKLDVPVAIFHGQYDGTVRVEGVRETEAAFAKAGRTNLTVHIYPRSGHDLSYHEYLKTGDVPAPYVELFDFVETLVQDKSDG